MSTTRTAPAWSLPGFTYRPGLAAWKVAVATARTACAGDLAGRRVDAARDVAGHDRARRSAAIAAIASPTRPRGSPLKPVPEERVDDDGRAVERRRVEAPRRVARQALQLHRRVAAERRGVARRQDPHLAPGLAQEPRAGVAVAAVVAAAADDDDVALRRDLLDERREPRRGGLHEVERRDPLLLDRPAVGRARSLGVRQRRHPARQGHAATATAPAVVAVCVSVRRMVTPSSSARRCGRAGEARGRPPRAVADDLDLTRAQHVEAERLRHRLLRAEPRGEMLRRAARAPPRRPARHR